MKRTIRFSLPVLTLAAAALLSSGCSSKPNDSQLTANVQSKIGSDPALQGQPISVAAKDGTVTLTGTVGAESSREQAARDAASVDGTRTVVNNLSVANAAAAGTPYAGGNEAPVNPAPASPANTPPPPSNAAAPAPPSSAMAPAPAQPLVIPVGTRIRVRLGQTISTKNSQVGDGFSAVLIDPIRVRGQVAIPAGAQARGTIVSDKSPGKFKGAGVLAIRLESLHTKGASYPIATNMVERTVQGKGKRSAVMTGGGAGLGAIIGGVAGGGKGALVGGLLGGGGGAAGSAFTGNKDLVLPAETVLTFDLHRSVRVGS